MSGAAPDLHSQLRRSAGALPLAPPCADVDDKDDEERMESNDDPVLRNAEESPEDSPEDSPEAKLTAEAFVENLGDFGDLAERAEGDKGDKPPSRSLGTLAFTFQLPHKMRTLPIFRQRETLSFAGVFVACGCRTNNSTSDAGRMC